VNRLAAVDRTTAVVTACLVAVTAALAQAVVQQSDVHGLDVRFRLYIASQAASPSTGLLVVVAAAAAVHGRRYGLVVQLFGVVLAVLAIVGAASVTTLPGAPGPAAWHVGIVLISLAGGVLAAFAVWLADSALAVPDAAGEPPD
jgi:hypothetical protein